MSKLYRDDNEDVQTQLQFYQLCVKTMVLTPNRANKYFGLNKSHRKWCFPFRFACFDAPYLCARNAHSHCTNAQIKIKTKC